MSNSVSLLIAIKFDKLCDNVFILRTRALNNVCGPLFKIKGGLKSCFYSALIVKEH